MYQLIVSDVDGTLVPDGSGVIDPAYFAAIQSLIHRGYTVVIASGRQYASIRHLFAPVAEQLWYITDGGGAVRGKGLLHPFSLIPEETVEDFCRDVLRLKASCPEVDLLLCSPDYAFIPSLDTPMARWLREDYHFDVMPLRRLTELPDQTIIKMSVYHPTNAEGVTAGWFQEKWKDRLYLACAGKEWIDAIMPGISKGYALGWLQQYLRIPREATLVSGDNLNDLSMFEQAGCCLAVENARAALKEKADAVIPGYRDKGVLEVWKKLCEG